MIEVGENKSLEQLAIEYSEDTDKIQNDIKKVIKWANGNEVKLINESDFPDEPIIYYSYKKIR